MHRETRARIIVAAVLLAAGLVWALPPAHACTTFCLRDHGRIVLGMNTDWMVPDAYLLVNKRGVARVAMVDDSPAEWTSRHGSVTFNQYGRDFPMGGMNEAGLVIQNLWLDAAEYPPADERPALGVLSWIQYHLDTSSTVAEVLTSDERLRIESPVPLHYFVADRRGNVATVEFLGGRMVAHTGDDLHVAALTNSTYRGSVAAYKSEPSRWDSSSLGRFATAARGVEQYADSEDNPVAYAFQTLLRARVDATVWSEVYEIDRGRVLFRTRSDPRTKTLSLEGLDFSCTTSVLAIDINADVEGDVRKHLKPFTAAQNRALTDNSYRKTPFLRGRPEADRRKAADHANTARCVTD